MNTKVKVGIAAAIVAALVALIVLDQKTTPKDDAATRPASGGESITAGGSGGADAPSPRLEQADIDKLLKEAESKFKPSSPKTAPSGNGIKSPEEPNIKTVRPATTEEYVIKDGDTFESIAQAKMGNKSFSGRLAEANPGVKANALRVGKTIIIPGKVDKKEESAVAKDPAPSPAPAGDPAPTPKKPDAAPALANVDGKKVYTVQPSDTLSGISVKVYNTSRHYQKIYEANKDVIDDPNTLQVGLKLTMPDLPSKPAAANGSAAGAVPTTNPAPVAAPAGSKLVQVSEGASLWKIAEKFAAEKKIGIHDMMKLIVAANPDKLKDESSLLRLGWQLIIPE